MWYLIACFICGKSRNRKTVFFSVFYFLDSVLALYFGHMAVLCFESPIASQCVVVAMCVASYLLLCCLKV